MAEWLALRSQPTEVLSPSHGQLGCAGGLTGKSNFAECSFKMTAEYRGLTRTEVVIRMIETYKPEEPLGIIDSLIYEWLLLRDLRWRIMRSLELGVPVGPFPAGAAAGSPLTATGGATDEEAATP